MVEKPKNVLKNDDDGGGALLNYDWRMAWWDLSSWTLEIYEQRYVLADEWQMVVLETDVHLNPA